LTILRSALVLFACSLLMSDLDRAGASDSQVTLSMRVRMTAPEQHHESRQAENVVVWLRPVDGGTEMRAFPSTPLRLTQHNKSFEPHVLVVPVGAVVAFPNHDPFFHNVFSLFEGKRFDLGLYEAGTTKNVRFDRPGISYIFCNIHAEMSAVVIALNTPLYGISNRKGEVVIPEVPFGRYTLHLWSESALPATLDAMTREITVSAESSTLGVLEIPTRPVVNAHKNKYGMDYEPASPDTPGYAQP
jgi:plastocyanin